MTKLTTPVVSTKAHRVRPVFEMFGAVFEKLKYGPWGYNCETAWPMRSTARVKLSVEVAKHIRR